MMPEASPVTITRLLKAAINLQRELALVEIEDGLATLAEFSSALDAMPETHEIIRQWDAD